MTREFTETRQAQGFRSQAHLDAFYRYLDHTKSCTDGCGPGRAVPLDDGMQPTFRECAKAQQLAEEAR